MALREWIICLKRLVEWTDFFSFVVVARTVIVSFSFFNFLCSCKSFVIFRFCFLCIKTKHSYHSKETYFCANIKNKRMFERFSKWQGHQIKNWSRKKWKRKKSFRNSQREQKVVESGYCTRNRSSSNSETKIAFNGLKNVSKKWRKFEIDKRKIKLFINIDNRWIWLPICYCWSIFFSLSYMSNYRKWKCLYFVIEVIDKIQWTNKILRQICSNLSARSLYQ